jgi:hypothetical protein
MKKLLTHLLVFGAIFGLFAFVSHSTVFADECINPFTANGSGSCGSSQIPGFTKMLGLLIRLFFVIAGIVALIFLLMGAFAWVTSGGDEKAVQAAQQKIQAAVIGLVVMVAVLSIAVFMEQIVFNKQICFGLTCEINTSSIKLLEKAPPAGTKYCPGNPNPVPETQNC